jgi:hypothetical protein
MIVLVGNAPLKRDHSSLINSADLVVRFNIPRAYGAESGTKFDIWSIANSAGGKKFIDNQVFKNAAYKDQPSQLWLPRDVDVHKKLRTLYADSETLLTSSTEIDFSDEIIQANDLKNLHLVRFPSKIYWGCLDVLRKAATRHDAVRIPSTGFLTIYYVLQKLNQQPLTVIGFSFEGWNGHPWHLEKKIVKQWANDALLTLIPS